MLLVFEFHGEIRLVAASADDCCRRRWLGCRCCFLSFRGNREGRGKWRWRWRDRQQPQQSGHLNSTDEDGDNTTPTTTKRAAVLCWPFFAVIRGSTQKENQQHDTMGGDGKRWVATGKGGWRLEKMGGDWKRWVEAGKVGGDGKRWVETRKGGWRREKVQGGLDNRETGNDPHWRMISAYTSESGRENAHRLLWRWCWCWTVSVP